ncbi:MAG: hypothetical protein E6G97_01995 [Alphaproteobacteria bacterium]|nr:MAG: hypothetical protein E6G97_01995 [Alphaproteobacteria bacterium]
MSAQVTSWCWRRFGDVLMLVTETGGALVILAPSRRKAKPEIQTRDLKTGMLRAIHKDDEAAQLIAAAPDHLLIARAMTLSIATFERWQHPGKGEICFGGLRHATTLDQFGVPSLTASTRHELAAAVAKAEA